MKTRIIALLLIGVFCVSLAACDSGSVQSVIDNVTTTQEDTEENTEEYTIEVPDAVINISEEDDIALTGTLTEDYYINPYFGLKFNKPEDGTLLSLLDEGTDLMPFAQTYADGLGGKHINIRTASVDGSITAVVRAITSDEKGKTEEDLVQAHIESEKSMNEMMEIEAELNMETISIAGEDHPAFVETYEDEDDGTVRKNAAVYILKDDFMCSISISGTLDNFDNMLGLIERN